MKTIDEDIKSGKFKRVYLLYGEEDYLKQQYKRKLKAALVPPDDTMNFAFFEGKGIPPQELTALADTMPFFAEHRLILVENSGFFKNKCEELAVYLPEMPESACFVFAESEVDRRGKLYKAAAKIGRTVEFKTQKEDVLTKWILGRLKKEKKNITKPVLQLFLTKTGTDMGNIDRELEKLLCYTLEKPVIEAADVEAVCTRQAENQIFEMVNAIGRREQKRALSLYYDLLSLKEPPMRILYLISRQFRILLELKSMRGKNLDNSAMASKAGIPPFTVKRSLQQAETFTLPQLRQALEDGVELETDIKTGRISDQLAVELLIVKYTEA